MNAFLKVLAPADAATIAHSVLGYDRSTQELALELPIPLFVDTLALKLANVPPDDKYGALAYPLSAKAAGTFGFLLGFELDPSRCEYFLEPTAGRTNCFGPKKLAAVALLSRLTPGSRYARTEKPRISERELVLPTLRLLDQRASGWMATVDLIEQLTTLFSPSGQDTAVPGDRDDGHISQKVRSMILHRDHPVSFIKQGLVDYQDGGLRISDQGRVAVRGLLS